eukprot:TRINITY_DN60893_c0_g1_i1.p1 TRINITY_DN60893_c0_g1~~TRINITY_DN60893_c0_g1_i1.p1  ORF type:complete len:245 (+),score=56.75 TRINITY_DN60893_c0_g1_i1:170-904(+)
MGCGASAKNKYKVSDPNGKFVENGLKSSTADEKDVLQTEGTAPSAAASIEADISSICCSSDDAHNSARQSEDHPQPLISTEVLTEDEQPSSVEEMFSEECHILEPPEDNLSRCSRVCSSAVAVSEEEPPPSLCDVARERGEAAAVVAESPAVAAMKAWTGSVGPQNEKYELISYKDGEGDIIRVLFEESPNVKYIHDYNVRFLDDDKFEVEMVEKGEVTDDLEENVDDFTALWQRSLRPSSQNG